LSKRVAELAGISLDEMKSMIKMPTIQRPKNAAPRQVRTTVSLQRRFLLMLLMRPDLVIQRDLDWVQSNTEEERLLSAGIQVALTYPTSKPAAILHQLQDKADARLIREVERELHLLDESLDIALEFNGARHQLMEMYQQQSHSSLLDRLKEKSLSELTEQDRALLKTLGNSAKNKQQF
jgi:DNA primase